VQFYTCAFVGIVYKTAIFLSKYFRHLKFQWKVNSSLEVDDWSFSHRVLFVPVQRALRYTLDKKLTGWAPGMTPWRSPGSRPLIPFLEIVLICPVSLLVIKTELKFSPQVLMKARLSRSVIKTISLFAGVKFVATSPRVYICFL
jgi:hypothetical protein